MTAKAKPKDHSSAEPYAQKIGPRCMLVTTSHYPSLAVPLKTQQGSWNSQLEHLRHVQEQLANLRGYHQLRKQFSQGDLGGRQKYHVGICHLCICIHLFIDALRGAGSQFGTEASLHAQRNATEQLIRPMGRAQHARTKGWQLCPMVLGKPEGSRMDERAKCKELKPKPARKKQWTS